MFANQRQSNMRLVLRRPDLTMQIRLHFCIVDHDFPGMSAYLATLIELINLNSAFIPIRDARYNIIRHK